jgi:hypothetical protein
MVVCVAACLPAGDCCAAIHFAVVDMTRCRKRFGGVTRLQVSAVILSEERSDESKDRYRQAEIFGHIGVLRLCSSLAANRSAQDDNAAKISTSTRTDQTCPSIATHNRSPAADKAG